MVILSFIGVGGSIVIGEFFLVEVWKFLEFLFGDFILDKCNEDVVWLFIGNIDINLGIL